MRRLFNFFRDYVLEYLLIVVALVGVFYLAFTHGSYARPVPPAEDPNYYANKLFDQSRVHKIEIEIADESYQDLLENPLEKTKYATHVIIDGERFKDVAFSTRGNGTLGNAASNLDTDRYSYMLNFKKFDSHNSYHGLDKLVLNSLYYEPSYLRSYLAFKLAGATGLHVPLTSFTEVYINGELSGLYLAIEAVDRSFLNRTGADADAALFHPVPYDVDADRMAHDAKFLPAGETLDPESHPDSSENTHGGSDLVYRGDAPDAYNSIFKNASTKYSKADETLVIKGIESLSEFSLSHPEEYWHIDSVLQFFATSALALNVDSYLNYLAQNYYLEVSNGKLSLVPWDYDRAFNVNGLHAESTEWDDIISWPIDSPTFNSLEDASRPLWRIVLEDKTLLSRYHELLQTTLDRYIYSGDCERDYNQAVELIRHYVYSDPMRLYTTEEFEDEVIYLRNYLALRTDSVQKQLWGLAPRTKGNQISDEERLEFIDLQTVIDY